MPLKPSECVFALQKDGKYTVVTCIPKKIYESQGSTSGRNIKIVFPFDTAPYAEDTWETKLDLRTAKVEMIKAGFIFSEELQEEVGEPDEN